MAASSSSSPSLSSSLSNSPCAACKFLRRKCQAECVFAPYFPPDQPQKFANVHKVFGASNVTKLLNELDPHQREDAVNSLAYEADMRLRDPVYGCVGVISLLQHQLRQLQMDLTFAKSELSKYHHHQINLAATVPHPNPNQSSAAAGINHLYHHTFFPGYSNNGAHQQQYQHLLRNFHESSPSAAGNNNNVVYEGSSSLLAMNNLLSGGGGGYIIGQQQQQQQLSHFPQPRSPGAATGDHRPTPPIHPS